MAFNALAELSVNNVASATLNKMRLQAGDSHSRCSGEHGLHGTQEELQQCALVAWLHMVCVLQLRTQAL